MAVQMLAPDEIRQRLISQLAAETSCSREDGIVLVDTPFTLLSGHVVRAHVRVEGDRLVVSDGGFVERQLALSTRSSRTFDRWSSLVAQIARRAGLEWRDGLLLFESRSWDDALRRIPKLAEAMDRALARVQERREPRSLRTASELARDLRQLPGLEVRRHAGVSLPHRSRPVRVEILAARAGRQAAIEVVCGTPRAAEHRADHAITTLTILTRFEFPGPLVAAYDRTLEQTARWVLERLEDAKPPRAELLPAEQVRDRVAELLG